MGEKFCAVEQRIPDEQKGAKHIGEADWPAFVRFAVVPFPHEDGSEKGEPEGHAEKHVDAGEEGLVLKLGRCVDTTGLAVIDGACRPLL